MRNLGPRFLCNFNMFAYVIVHLTYAPQIVAHASVFTNVYSVVNLQER